MDLSDLPAVRTRLLQILKRRARNPDLADDLCQTVLLKSWAYSCRHGVLPPPSYIVQSGMNEFYSWHRRRRPQQLAADFDQAARDSDPAGAAEAIDRGMVRAVLDALPPRYRDVARLRFIEEWPEHR